MCQRRTKGWGILRRARSLNGKNNFNLSNNFATQSEDKFDGIDFERTEEGVPLLKDTLGTIECRMHAVHEGGDHQIIVGEVFRINNTSKDRNPLTFYKGVYGALK